VAYLAPERTRDLPDEMGPIAVRPTRRRMEAGNQAHLEPDYDRRNWGMAPLSQRGASAILMVLGEIAPPISNCWSR
jgi:hypothetical protein